MSKEIEGTTRRLIIFSTMALALIIVLSFDSAAFTDDCFDAGEAFAHVRAMVEIGPRPAGSPGAGKTQAYIMDNLARLGLEVIEQDFVADTPFGLINMKNIVGIIPGQSNDVIIIGAHYDTKRFDYFEFVGANDSGSGTAVLLEMARCLQNLEIEPTIWLVFFDGEEAFVRWTKTDSLYGSRHMVDRLEKEGRLSTVKAVIILDMVGDRHLSIEWETNSTAWLREIVWANAEQLGHERFFKRKPHRISDDHIPFLQHGIPSIDIIDLHYGPESLTNEYWHTPEDTLDKVSPSSLKIVGDVTLKSLPQIADQITTK